MSENENKNISVEEKPLNEEVSLKTEPIDIPFSAGEKANDVHGEKADDNAFKFVQQDKKIHDTKFSTRPTTFIKDAFRRFRKNKSSVVAGCILGTLFALAIVIPFDVTIGDTQIATVPYDIKNIHNYETNLPSKLFPAGTGFWDGTRTFENQTLPYELNEDGTLNYDVYKGSYTDPDVIVDIKNIKQGYINYASAEGSGGYAKIEKDASGDKGTQLGYMYCYPMSFDLEDNDYTLTYNLGTREGDGYVDPNFALLLYGKDGSINLLTDYSKDYGPEVDKADEKMTITPHEEVTVSLDELIASKGISSEVTSQDFSVGFIMQSDLDNKTALYVHDFTISGKKRDGSELSSSEKRVLRSRSFGTSDCLIKDANTLARQEVDNANGSKNQSYWTAITDVRFDSSDTYTTTCDLVIDMYKYTYGWTSGITVFSSTFDEWLEKGYIEYDFSLNNVEAPKSFKITEAGEASGEVYVRSVENQKSADVDGKTAYSMSCTVMMYKWLGYSKMPTHLFGTEAQGKDMLKYVFSGLRTSLILGVIVAFINIAIGVTWGSISGYFGGIIDLMMERFTDILVGIPWIVLMTVLSLKLGQTFFVFALALCLTGWIGTESMTRSQFYRYRGREYVLAAKTLGAKAPRLIFRHILPNAIGPIITSSVLMIPSTIFSEATISYLGLGLKNLDSLGVILSDTQKNLSVYPAQLLIPAVIISLLMICFNLFGNGLRDAVNPSLKGSD